MVIDVTVLTTGWTIAGVIASSSVAVIALGLGVLSLRQTQRLQKRERKARILNEIITWVLNVKLSMVHADTQAIMLGRKQRYNTMFLAISDALLNAELMSLRASENSIPEKKELNDVWHAAFFCSQLAARITGKKPSEEQRKRWSKNAIDIITRIDQLEEQGKLTDQ